MKPIKFEGSNVVYAEDQDEYLDLPAFRAQNGDVVTCWKMEPKELAEVMKTGVVYLMQKTFNEPLQPILVSSENPYPKDD